MYRHEVLTQLSYLLLVIAGVSPKQSNASADHSAASHQTHHEATGTDGPKHGRGCE